MNTQNHTLVKPRTLKYIDWGEDASLGEDSFSHWFSEDIGGNGKTSILLVNSAFQPSISVASNQFLYKMNMLFQELDNQIV